MQMIRKSASALVFKIIIAELLIEIIYLLLSLGLASFSEQLSQNYEYFRSILTLIFIAIAISILALLVAQWANEGYLLEKNGILVRKGIINSSLKTYPYADIESIEIHRSRIGKILNYGSVSIFAPSVGYRIIFQEISNPEVFSKTVRSKIQQPYKTA